MSSSGMFRVVLAVVVVRSECSIEGIGARLEWWRNIA